MGPFGPQQIPRNQAQMNQATMMAMDQQYQQNQQNQRYSMNTNDIVQIRNREMQGQGQKP